MKLEIHCIWRAFMTNLLEEMVMDFSNEIKDNFATYSAIYVSFVEYIKEQYTDYEYSLEYFLEHDLSRRDIIKSCIRYIQNSAKVKKETAIDKYLNAMTKLYEECISKKHFNNRNLFAILPFGSLKSEVKEQLKDNYLKEKEALEAINDKDADKILNYLTQNKTKEKVVFLRNSILLKLIILYGFKLERLKYMIVEDVDLDKHILNIRNTIYDGISIQLELPFGLVQEIRGYIELLKKDIEFSSSQFLFLSSNKKIIDSSFAQTIIENIKDTSCNVTLTGIAKFAIINMIREGINKANIKLITGMQDIIVDDCEKKFLEQQFQEANDTVILNRDINKKIRGIETFDKLLE